MKYNLLFMVVTSTLLGAKDGPPSIKIIKPNSAQELAPIIKQIKKQFNVDQEEYHEYRYLDSINGYILDINNDGKIEYVFEDYQGSGGYLCLHIFRKEGDLFKSMEYEKCPNFDFDGPFHNPLTNSNELFVSVGNIIYICTGGSHRCVQEWNRDTITISCNAFWIGQQRALFNELYKNKLYDAAAEHLNAFEKSCRHKIDPQTDLWMRNDVALALYKDNKPYTALARLQNIKKDTAYAHASEALKKAITTNETLCRDAIKEEKGFGTKGKYDFSWLLKKGYSISDYNNLFAATIPDIYIEQYYEHAGELNDRESSDLRGYIQIHFGCSCDDNIIVDQRYVTLQGWFPHNATSRGFMWVDTILRVSIAAIGVVEPNHSKSIYPLQLFSRSLLFGEIPANFLEQFKKWIKENEIQTKHILFYDRFGAVSQIKL